jgi:predicted nucleotide-binding protein
LPEAITLDGVEDLLKAHNIGFSTVDIQHGRQFRFGDGAILNAYHSGKINWQGKNSPIAERVRSLLAQDPLPGGASISTTKLPAEIRHSSNNKVFIVHGHDVSGREQLELLLRRMRPEPVILQNLVGAGDTIIEKLESNLDVRYACVLLTPRR